MSDYNGWSNRATWNANMWLFGNDEGTYRMAEEIVSSRLGIIKAAKELSAFAAEMWGEGTPDGCGLKDVKWREIVKSNRS